MEVYSTLWAYQQYISDKFSSVKDFVENKHWLIELCISINTIIRLITSEAVSYVEKNFLKGSFMQWPVFNISLLQLH